MQISHHDLCCLAVENVVRNIPTSAHGELRVRADRGKPKEGKSSIFYKSFGVNTCLL